jgi:hypothetical protein
MPGVQAGGIKSPRTEIPGLIGRINISNKNQGRIVGDSVGMDINKRHVE